MIATTQSLQFPLATDVQSIALLPTHHVDTLFVGKAG
jgi:hypothetical protein